MIASNDTLRNFDHFYNYDRTNNEYFLFRHKEIPIPNPYLIIFIILSQIFFLY